MDLTDMHICAVSSKNAPHLWDIIDDMILDALDYANGKFTIDDIHEAILNRDMQLWVIIDGEDIVHAVVVTQVIHYPSKKVMLFVLVSGVKFDNWKHLLPHFELFAKDHDCTAIEFYGRTGWEKKTRELGFKKIHTVFSLDIKGDFH